MGAKSSVLVATPIHEPDERFCDSLPKFLNHCKEDYDITAIHIRGKQLVDAQNTLSKYFMTDTKCDYLLMLEDDHWGHTKEMLDSLIKSDSDVCAINYYSRHSPFYSCLMRELPGRPPSQRFAGHSFKEGYHECDLVGFAMTLIKREVFNRLPKPYFRLNEFGGEGSYATDINFCDRVKKKGMKIMGCFDYCLPHRDITSDNIDSVREEGWKGHNAKFLLNAIRSKR